MKTFTSPANELLLHRCRITKKIRECKKKMNSNKKIKSPADEFSCIVEVGNLKNNNKINFEKNVQVEFLYINVKIIGK